MYVIFCRKSLKYYVRSYENFFRKHVQMYVKIAVNLINLLYFKHKMAALNKHALLAAVLVILRRRGRRSRKELKFNKDYG